MMPEAQVKSELLRRVAFFSRYEASQSGSHQVRWPHLLLGLMREAKPLVRNFLPSDEAVVGFRVIVEKSISVGEPRPDPPGKWPMDPDVVALLEFADKQARPGRVEGPLEALFAGMVKSRPEWFSQHGLDVHAVESSFVYPSLELPVTDPDALPVIRLEFQGVLTSLEAKLRPMPERRAEEPTGDHRSRKQWIGDLIDAAANQHQICIRALASQNDETSFPDYDPAVWAEVTGYRHMPWSVLMDLCITYHRLLYGILETTPEQKLKSVVCSVGSKPPLPLSDLFRQFVSRLRDQTKNCPE